MVDGDDVLEQIPLHEIYSTERVMNRLNSGAKDNLVDIEKLNMEQWFTNAIQILTIQNGYNCGRAYYIRTDSSIQCTTLVEEISKAVVSARARYQFYYYSRHGSTR